MDQTTLSKIKDNFVTELKQAESGRKNSLAFIINQIPDQPLVQEGEVFEVLTIGGSVSRKALIKKHSGELEIIKQQDGVLQTLKTKQDLFDCIENLLEPDVRVVAINFAYPLEPVFTEGKLDGVLLAGSKEHEFDGIVGKTVGAEIEQYIRQKLNRQIVVSLANDTICLLLSGLTKSPWNKLAAGIVGTGFNFALFLTQDKLVNLEAANFDKFDQTPEGKEIDSQSNHVGTAKLEKEVAGAYLYKHFNLMIKDQKLDYPEISTSKELDAAAMSTEPKIAEIAQSISTRAAQLVACVVAGILEYSARDLTFVMEGSLFWKGIKYKETIEQTVKQLSPNFKAEFISVDDSTILGGAKLVA